MDRDKPEFKFVFEFAGRRVERSITPPGSVSAPPGMARSEILSEVMRQELMEAIERGEMNSMLKELLQ